MQLAATHRRHELPADPALGDQWKCSHHEPSIPLNREPANPITTDTIATGSIDLQGGWRPSSPTTPTASIRREPAITTAEDPPHWNRHALLSPKIKHLLDAVFRFPSRTRPSGRQIVNDALDTVASLLEQTVDPDASVIGYDRAFAKRVSALVAEEIDNLGSGTTPGQAAYDAVLAGACIGVAVGSGGRVAHGRYFRRLGALTTLVEHLGIDAIATLDRDRRMLAATGDQPIALHPPERAALAAPTAPSSATTIALRVSTVRHLRPAVIGQYKVRRVECGGQQLALGTDVCLAFNYASPSSTLSHFIRSGENLHVMVDYPTTDGEHRPLVFLTTRGIIKLTLRAREAGRPKSAIAEWADRLIGSLLPDDEMKTRAIMASMVNEIGRLTDQVSRVVRISTRRQERYEALTAAMTGEYALAAADADDASAAAARAASDRRNREATMEDLRFTAMAQVQLERSKRQTVETDLAAARKTIDRLQGELEQALAPRPSPTTNDEHDAVRPPNGGRTASKQMH